MPTKKAPKQGLCTSCEVLYEEARAVLLGEIAARDLKITQLKTQVSLLETTVTNQAELLAAKTEKTQARRTA